MSSKRRNALRLAGTGVRLAGGGGDGFVGPYDAIPSITAAYGMRRLRSAYTGSLLRLRRSSDNAESDFGYTGTGDLDTAAIATWLGANSGLVTTWYDQSGNGNHATQTVAGSQPQYSTSYLTLNGSHHLTTTIVPANNQQWSLIAKFSNATLGAFAALIGVGWATGQGVILSVDSIPRRSYYNGSFRNVGVSTTAGVLAVAGAQGYYNGAADGAAIASVSATNTYTLAVGALNQANTIMSKFNGRLHEIVVSSSTYNATQVAAITTIMG